MSKSASNFAKTMTYLICALVIAVAQPAFSQNSVSSAASRVAQEFDLSARLNWNYRPPGRSISLYRWMIYQMERTEEARKLPRNYPAYDRAWHFGGWVNEDGPRDCLDTRQEVLVRAADDQTPVVYHPSNNCKVATGAWFDPYSGQSFRVAQAMDIDHVVALGHAYDAGAYKWTPALRCHYANFLNNGFHLLAVSAHENRSKSAKDPTGYIPPYRPFVCTYLSFWLKIKLVWDLEITRPEAVRIAEVFQKANCDMRSQVMGQRELEDQQRYASRASVACERKMQNRGSKPPPPVVTLFE